VKLSAKRWRAISGWEPFTATLRASFGAMAKPSGSRSRSRSYGHGRSACGRRSLLNELRLDDRRYKPTQVLHQILAQKQEGRGPNEMRTKGWFDDAVANVYAKYNQYLRAANAVDFEDFALARRRDPREPDLPASKEIERRFDFVLVDEFQDTNQIAVPVLESARARAQEPVASWPTTINRSTGWRGADVRNIRGFLNDFPDAQMIKLEQNYRSTKNIVRGGARVIEPSRDRVRRSCGPRTHPASSSRSSRPRNERDEAALVARTIDEAQRQGIAPGEVAVLLSHHAQSRVLEEAAPREQRSVPDHRRHEVLRALRG